MPKSFPVRVPYGPPGHFLGQRGDEIVSVPGTVEFDGATIANPEILVFRFRSERSMREDQQIERRVDELNGDPEETADLAIGLDQAIREAREDSIRILWPEGRPEAKGPDLDAQEKAINAQFSEHKNKGKIERMMWLQARQDCTACWSVLIESPPSGWEDIMDKPLKPSVISAIVNAWTEARAKAEAGK